MKTHTLIRESVLSASDVDRESDQNVIAKAIKIAGGHHEKWDGSDVAIQNKWISVNTKHV